MVLAAALGAAVVVSVSAYPVGGRRGGGGGDGGGGGRSGSRCWKEAVVARTPRQATRTKCTRDSSVDDRYIVREVAPGEARSGRSGRSSEHAVASGALHVLKKLFIPQRGVTDDYLVYQLWTFPSHVFGWMSHSLVSSSMLSALGVGASAATTVGLSAGIKWVMKDGVGAAGRLFVGGNLGVSIDEDTKRWRMIAEVFTTLGLFLEIATQLSPSDFVLLAGGGTVAKAVGAGIGRPCFRVIQNHFAKVNNIGDVSAKEEVWETTAQLVGIAASVALLRGLEAMSADDASVVVPAWFAVQGLHVVVRWHALRVLQFPWPNFKRGNMLASAYIGSEGGGEAAVPGLVRVNFDERMGRGTTRLVHGTVCLFGSGWQEAVGTRPAAVVQEVIRLYRGEQYVLVVDGDGRGGRGRSGGEREIRVVLCVDATGEDMMKAMLQASWIDEYAHAGGVVDGMELQRESLRYAKARFGEFQELAEAAGWRFAQTQFPLDRDVRLERLEVV